MGFVFTRSRAPAWERTLWKLCFPGAVLFDRRLLPVPAGRGSRASWPLVPKRELGNEGQRGIGFQPVI